jgi:hypothetical protein
MLGTGLATTLEGMARTNEGIIPNCLNLMLHSTLADRLWYVCSMYIYIYIFIYIYIYIYMFIYTYTYRYIYIYTYVYIWICQHAYLCI